MPLPPPSTVFAILLLPMSARTQSVCSNVLCPAGQTCDENTGICRYFRSPMNIPINRCVGVQCPANMQCDSNTGQCIRFRSPTSTQNLCVNVICLPGQKCDYNSGQCVTFRTPYRRYKKSCEDELCSNRIRCDQADSQCSRRRMSRVVFARALSHSPCHQFDCPDGYFCDMSTGRCILVSGQGSDLCFHVNCSDGYQCNPLNGTCYRPKYPKYKCRNVQCPVGTSCESTTGKCVQLQPAIVSATDSLCFEVFCPQGTSCDSNTGICRQFRPVQTTPSSNLCTFVNCPTGYSCNPVNGTCVQVRQVRRTLAEPVSCPLNSHFVECGSPCPYTCSEVRRACSLPCVSTCQCDEAYVQVSLTNVTCVPTDQCRVLGQDMCANLKCPDEMICVDGYCNPVNCPKVTMPNLLRGCAYDLNRDERNCLILEVVC